MLQVLDMNLCAAVGAGLSVPLTGKAVRKKVREQLAAKQHDDRGTLALRSLIAGRVLQAPAAPTLTCSFLLLVLCPELV